MDIPINILERYSRKNGVGIDEARSIFFSLEKFLCEAVDESQSPTEIIYAAWHEFILHTKEYTDYCLSKFGRYIHHVPDDSPRPDGMASCSCSSGCDSA